MKETCGGTGQRALSGDFGKCGAGGWCSSKDKAAEVKGSPEFYSCWRWPRMTEKSREGRKWLQRKERSHMFNIRLSSVFNCRGIKLRPLHISLIWAREQKASLSPSSEYVWTGGLERQKSSLYGLHMHKPMRKRNHEGKKHDKWKNSINIWYANMM